MKHQITVTQTGDNWEVLLRCEFTNATIAELVIQDTKTMTYDGDRQYIQECGHKIARLERANTIITLTSYNNGGWQLNCGSQEDTKASLEAIACSWQAREGIYLPAMQYFEAGAKAYNESFRKWSEANDEDLKKLEHRIEELERKRDADQSKAKSDFEWLIRELRGYGEALDEAEEAFSLHKKSRFH